MFDEEADAEVLDAVVVDVLVAGADVLDREVADAEVADAVVEWLILETALNAVPIPGDATRELRDGENQLQMSFQNLRN